MSQNERPSRESIWTVARGWVKAYFIVFTTLNTMNIARIVWFQTTQANHAGWSQMIDAIVDGIGGGALGVAAMTISFTDIGRATMVLAGMFEEWVRRRRERQMNEAIAEVDGLWRAWNGRRLDALAKGEPFDEPPPDVSGARGTGGGWTP